MKSRAPGVISYYGICIQNENGEIISQKAVRAWSIKKAVERAIKEYGNEKSPTDNIMILWGTIGEAEYPIITR